jgi:DNA primase
MDTSALSIKEEKQMKNHSLLKEVVKRIKEELIGERWADFIRRDGVSLSPCASGWTGLSPFRIESQRSFFVKPDGWWQDFSGATYIDGDQIDYVRKRFGDPFTQAVARLATFVGVPIPDIGSENWQAIARLEQERRRMSELITAAALFYHSCVTDEVRQRLDDQWGLTEEAIKRFLLGFAKGDDSLYPHLLSLGFTREEILRSGLFVLRRTDLITASLSGRLDDLELGGQPVELFRRRITFPHMTGDRVSYVAARTVDEVGPSTPKFLKMLVHSKAHDFVSQTITNSLYNINDARGSAELLLCEGYADTVAAAMLGFKVVSPGTINLNRGDHDLLFGALHGVKKVTIVFDSEANRAGETGAAALGQLLHEHGENTCVAQFPLPDGYEKIDVADYLKSHTREEFEAILIQAKPYPEFLLDRVPATTPAAELDAALSETMRAIAIAPSDLVRDHYIGLVSKKFKLRKALTRSLLKKAEEAVDAERAAKEAKASDTDEDAVDATATSADTASSSSATPPPGSTSSTGASATAASSPGTANASATGSALAAAQADERLPWEGDTDEPAALATNELRFKDPVLEDAHHFFFHMVAAGLTKKGKTRYAPQPISNFTLKAVERIWTPAGEVLVVDAHVHGGQVHRGIVLPVSAFKTAKDLRQALKRADLAWLGTDGQTQQLQYKLSRQCRRRREGVSTIGYVETRDGRVWVGPSGAIIRTGWEPEEVDDVIFTPSGSQLERRVRYEHAEVKIVRDLARRVLAALLRLNRLRTILPVIAWFFATLFAPRLREMYGMFPVLVCWGTKGTGKSSLIAQIFWPIFGITRHEPFAASDTRFAFLRLLSSTASVAVVVDEYKPRDLKEDQVLFINRLVRQVTGGEEANRGRSDKGVDGYLLVAPLCIIGEQRPEHDAAIADRIVSVQPDANALVDNPEFVSTFERVRREKLGLLAIPLIEFALGRDVRAEFEAARAEADPVIDRIPSAADITARCRYNMHVVAFGLRTFRAFADSLGVALPEFDLREAFVSTIDDVMDGSGGGRSALDEFVETCSFLATLPPQQAGALIENTHFKFVNGLLFIHTEAAFELSLSHWRRTGRTPAASEVRVIKKLAKEAMRGLGYVRKVGHSVSMDQGLRPRCIGIDLVEAAHVIDVSGFGRHIDSVRVDDENVEEEAPFRKGIYLALA